MNPYSRLRRVLADLYPSVDASILFMAEMGMASGRILVEMPPQTRWHMILMEARKADSIAVLLEVALADYPDNQELEEIRLLLRPGLVAPQYDLAKVVPPTATKEPLDRIVGGRLTTAFPDCCAVGDEDGYFCSGTLIGPRRVLTAKHCAEGGITRIFARGYDVSDAESGEVIAVTSLRLHPSADLMLLTLAADALTPVRAIATSEEIEALAPMTCTLVGFGTIDTDGTIGYGIKRRVETPIVILLCGGPEDETDFGCQQGVEMVAGQRGLNRDTCQGDSGGPLYVQYADGSYRLLGVTSRGITGGRNCGDGGVYVRADKFAEWIAICE